MCLDGVTPLLIGIFGDWIFGAPDGSYWHLDLIEGSFGRVAQNSTEFNAKKGEEQYRVAWFGSDWADIALEHGLTPMSDQCLGWKIAPVFGGPFTIENIQIFSLVVYQSLQGQIFRQLNQH